MSVRILIADDHGVMRAGLRAMLEDEPELEVVGEAINGEETLRFCGRAYAGYCLAGYWHAWLGRNRSHPPA